MAASSSSVYVIPPRAWLSVSESEDAHGKRLLLPVPLFLAEAGRPRFFLEEDVAKTSLSFSDALGWKSDPTSTSASESSPRGSELSGSFLLVWGPFTFFSAAGLRPLAGVVSVWAFLFCLGNFSGYFYV